MPFTPFHMGPGILFKALLQGSFSLMVLGAIIYFLIRHREQKYVISK
jgi:hypothetical protein